MTVFQLIEKLKEYPPEATVVYRCCSDYSELLPEEIHFAKAEEKKVAMIRDLYRHVGGTHPFTVSDTRMLSEFQMQEGGRFIDALMLPGN